MREKGIGQVIKKTFVSLDFHRKKWKKLLGEKHSKALLFWPSKEGGYNRDFGRRQQKGKMTKCSFLLFTFVQVSGRKFT